MKCEKCQGDMWDNTKKKLSPKSPDFKCKDKECGFAVWLKPEERAKLEAEENKGQEKLTKLDPEFKSLDDMDKSFLISYIKDLVVAEIGKGFYKDQTSAGLGFVNWYNLLISLGKKEEVKTEEQPF